MQGYSISVPVGAWKYTCSVMLSRSVWSCRREAIIHLPQTQDQTGVLDFHILHSPTNPRPINVTNGEVLLSCKSIGHDADRITRGSVRVHLSTRTEETPILNNVAIVVSLRDDLLVHTRCSFGGLSVPDLTVKPRHRVSGSD